MTEPRRGGDPLEEAIAALREPVELRPDLTQRVMAELEQLPPYKDERGAGGAPWWRREWTVRLSPLRVTALAAGLVAFMLGIELVRRDRPTAPAPPAPLATGSSNLIQFVLVAPGAKAVTLVGDFNDWSLEATPLARAAGDGGGLWQVSLPLGPGRYRYAFVVDGGNWRSDPEAPAAQDDFGRASSVITVGGEGGGT